MDKSDNRGQVKTLPLPPNCIFIHQPMDLRAIAECKIIYRRSLLVDNMDDIENFQPHRNGKEKNDAGMKGFPGGYDPHVQDVTKILAKS